MAAQPDSLRGETFLVARAAHHEDVHRSEGRHDTGVAVVHEHDREPVPRLLARRKICQRDLKVIDMDNYRFDRKASVMRWSQDSTRSLPSSRHFYDEDNKLHILVLTVSY